MHVFHWLEGSWYEFWKEPAVVLVTFDLGFRNGVIAPAHSVEHQPVVVNRYSYVGGIGVGPSGSSSCGEDGQHPWGNTSDLCAIFSFEFRDEQETGIRILYRTPRILIGFCLTPGAYRLRERFVCRSNPRPWRQPPDLFLALDVELRSLDHSSIYNGME